MRIIDLLVKMSKGEQLPKKIRYRHNLFVFNKNDYDYKCDGMVYRLFDWIEPASLNDFVEVVDDKYLSDNSIDALRYYPLHHVELDKGDSQSKTNYKFAKSLNKVIDQVNKLNQDNVFITDDIDDIFVILDDREEH